jgi:signal transduction histidine kinase
MDRGESQAPPGDAPHDGVDAAVHEAQNALACARGWVELARSLDDPALHRRALDAIAPALSRAGRILGGLVRQSIPPPAPFDANAVLDEVAALVEASAAAQGVTVVREGPRAECPCEGDADAAAQVLTNLTLNAVRATADAIDRGDVLSARVVLSYAVSGRVVRLMVRDGAGGFARSRPSERPSEPGTGRGLGLAVSRGLAARMGASLTLDDDGRGVLATLGVRRSGATGAVATESGSRRIEGGVVLVLDDDAAIAEMLSVALPLRGVAVEVTTRIDEAWSVLQSALVRAAVVDLKLGAEDGAAFVRSARMRFPDVRWVLVSGANLDGAARAAADVTLRKPFALDELVRVLQGDG